MKRWLAPAVFLIAIVAVAIGATFFYRNFTDHQLDSACSDNLHRIGLALHAYADDYNSNLPPAYVLGKDGERWHSWRVLLLPYLGEKALYREYRFDEPWNGPNNRKLADRMPEIYGCPADDEREPGQTNYFALVGPQTGFPEQYSANFVDIKDGTSNSIGVVEGLPLGETLDGINHHRQLRQQTSAVL